MVALTLLSLKEIVTKKYKFGGQLLYAING